MSQLHGPDNQRPHRPMYDQDARPGGTGDVRGSAAGPVRSTPPPSRPARATASRSGGRAAHVSPRTVERRRKKRRRQRIAILSALTVLVLLVAGVVGLINWVKGQLMDNSEAWSGSQVQAMNTDALPEYHGKDIVAGLVCGIDYNNEDASGYVDPNNKLGNTDMILYVMFDMANMKLNILQIPRDMYVGEEVDAGAFKKINGVYAAAPAEKRMEALAKVVNQQMKLPVDFYLKLDLDAVKALVDHAGFIEVYIPHDIVNVDKNTGRRETVLTEGWTNITSQQIESLVRNRNYPDGDITRLRTQQSLYSALFRQFKTLSPWDLVMWMRILLYYVDVNGLSAMEVGGIAQKGLGIAGSDVTFVRPPYAGTQNPRGDGQDYIYLLAEETAEVLDQYFRPDGHSIPAEELGIHTFDTAEYGSAPAEVRTMGDIQASEAPPPAA